MTKYYQTRRSFLKTAAAASGVLWSVPAISYGRIIGANERVHVAAIGTNSRGTAVAESFSKQKNALVSYVCDVDSRVLPRTGDAVTKIQGSKPTLEKDFRKMLEDDSVDAVLIAMPDHWHAPASIMALQAGKHVYVEKPCGHNPAEGEMLIRARDRFGKLVQMGTQQRSAPESIKAVQDMAQEKIGRPYAAMTWYANKRDSIGRGKQTDVPQWLDYDLWQGPAPRLPFRDNVVHYNWHWFKNWGTGELCNNGTHEIDFARWALGVQFPSRVTSHGGRYHFQDDWEFYDTQMVTYDFPDGSTITWEGRSCNSYSMSGRGRGTILYGTAGSILVDREEYILFDQDNKEVKREKVGQTIDGLNTTGADILTDYHTLNFVNAIRQGDKLNAPIEEGHKSVLLCHLGNIAQQVGRGLQLDPQNGHILNDDDAVNLWSRNYEPGWEPEI